MSLQKILVLCFSDNLGGMELDALRFCSRLSNYFEITFIAPEGSKIEKAKKIDRVDEGAYKFITCNLTRLLARSLIDPNIVTTVHSVAKKEMPDLVVFFGTSEIKSISVALIGINTRLVMRIGTTINRPKKNVFQRIFYQRVDAFMATSEHIKQNIKRVFPVASNRIVKICYPVVHPDEGLANANGEPDIIKIIYHSRFVRGKGQLDAVRAFHCIYHNIQSAGLRIELQLFGSFEDADYMCEIEDYICNNGLSGVVHVFPTRSDINSLLPNFNIFLGPSYGEGFSNSFVEALANGLICVVYDNTVFPHFKELGFDFLLAPTGNVEVLSQKLAEAICAHVNKQIDVHSNSVLVRRLFSVEAEKAVLEDILLSFKQSS